jgi:TPR repeat protein
MKTAVTLILSSLVTLILYAVPVQAAEISSGSGVVIGGQGEILTNSHVVEKCEKITVQFSAGNAETAALVARDERNDLAVIRVKTSLTSIATFREGTPLRAGDAIVALGYPLSGLLASTANLSVGNVSALAGLRDDSRYLQISAPVQPGNSGGPLLDASGHLVGIVTAKRDAARVAKFTGDIPQNVNFALKAEVVKTFLHSKGIGYQKVSSEQQLSPADIGDLGSPFTVHITCEQTKPPSVASVAPPAENLPRPYNKRSAPSNSPEQPVGNADELFKKGEAALAEKKFSEAMRWFRQAASKGHVGALARIGALYVKERNYRVAMVWSLEAAEKGNASAMNDVGMMYSMGLGVLPDFNEAMHWWRRAAEKGDPDGMHNIGVTYSRGQGVAADQAEAFRWYRRAADAGHTGAMRAVAGRYAKGEGVRQDNGEAMRWYRQAADKGNDDAMNDIGKIYLGVLRDFREAMHWFRQSAEKGNIFAMSNIAELYARGLGVSKDCKTARQWMEKAAAGVYVTRYQLTEATDLVAKTQEEIRQRLRLRSSFDGQCQW